MKTPVKYRIAISVIPLVLILDQWTKQLILDRFTLHESVEVIPNWFALTYVQNTGAAFGLFQSAHPAFRIPFFLTVPLIALGVIAWLFRSLPPRSIRGALSLSLVIAGAIGNLIDRIRLGYVVDFLDFHWQHQSHFPAFNVADMAICVGVGLLLLDLFQEERKKGK